MRLTEQVAMKYAKYRLRFLEGAIGPYEGTQYGTFDPLTEEFLVNVNVPSMPVKRVPAQVRGARVTFLRNITRPHDEPGCCVIAEKLSVDAATATESGNLDSAHVTSLKHGDNTLHASWAFATFVAEYVITHDLGALRLADRILRSFQRLGDYSPGHGEDPNRNNRPPNELWGYILRSDIVDDADSSERIQDWLADPDAKSSLEPSPDQYTSLFCASLVALTLLADAQAHDPDFPTSPDHVQLISGIRERVEERVRACHRYVAQHCRYFLKHPTGRMVKRGGWCWQFAYEFADVVATVLNEDFDDHFEPFALSMLPDIFSAFVTAPSGSYADVNAEHIADLLLNGVESLILDTTVSGVRDSLFAGMTTSVPILNEVTDLLSFLDDYSSLKTDVDGAIRDALRNWIHAAIRPPLKHILQTVIQAALDATGALDRAASKVLSKLLFKIAADLFFATNLPSLQIGGKLVTTVPASFFIEMGLFTPATLDRSIGIDVDIDVVTNGFTVKILGIEKTIGEITWGRFHLTVADLPLLDWTSVFDSFQIPVAFNAAEAIYRTADYCGFDDAWITQKLLEAVDLNPFRGDFLPFGYFVLMAANGSFGRYAYNGEVLSEAFENGFFAALDYRLNGSAAALHVLRDQVAVAPESYPNGRSDTIWDEDFLWLRDRQPGDDPSDKIFCGLDFLSAVSLAASADASGNRKVLRDAIERVLEESSHIDVPERDGVFNLPFRGPITGTTRAFVPSRDNIGSVPIVHVSVVFRSPGATGRVRIRIGNSGAAADFIDFRQNEPGKAVVVPLCDEGISIESADAGVVGVLVVAVP